MNLIFQATNFLTSELIVHIKHIHEIVESFQATDDLKHDTWIICLLC